MSGHPDAGNPAQALAEACGRALYARDRVCQALGIELLAIAPGTARLALQVRADMLQGLGLCHGGILFTLADAALAYASNSRDQACVTLGASIDYLAPARLGDRLEAQASELARSGRTASYDVRVVDQHGQLLAVLRGRACRVRGGVRARPDAGRADIVGGPADSRAEEERG